MEGAPKTPVVEQESDIESLSKWRELKETAAAQAETLIGGITGFAEMEASEKIVALDSLLSELANDNVNRFVAEAIATQASILEEDVRHTLRLTQLGVAA